MVRCIQQFIAHLACLPALSMEIVLLSLGEDHVSHPPLSCLCPFIALTASPPHVVCAARNITFIAGQASTAHTGLSVFDGASGM